VKDAPPEKSNPAQKLCHPSMTDLKFKEVSNLLLEDFPEFRARYEQGLSWWQGPEQPGQYVVFGFVLEPVLRELLNAGTDSTLLKRIFGFFETMASSSDIEVVNLLQVGIYESLVSERGRLAAAWIYMGEKTKGVARRIARIRDCEHNLPSD
jgi:hypothetical protein